MEMVFLPIVEGEQTVKLAAGPLRERLQARVKDGLIPNAPPHRNRYTITDDTDGEMTIQSESLATSAFVGLNRIALKLQPEGESTLVRYRIEFWEWVKFGIKISAFFFLVSIALLLTLPSLPSWSTGGAVEKYGLTFCRVWIAAFGIFFGLLWPWILAAIHRPRVNVLFSKILNQLSEA